MLVTSIFFFSHNIFSSEKANPNTAHSICFVQNFTLSISTRLKILKFSRVKSKNPKFTQPKICCKFTQITPKQVNPAQYFILFSKHTTTEQANLKNISTNEQPKEKQCLFIWSKTSFEEFLQHLHFFFGP